jgi:alpha-tubulin suppressor-like RCC1 family protein
MKADQSLWSWGLNDGGQLGDGTTMNKNYPVRVGSTNDWQELVSGGGAFSLALKTDGMLWAWGNNYHGQLGDGTTTNRTVPTLLACPIVNVSVETVAKENSVSIYPTPVNDLLNIRIPDNETIADVRITDLSGRIVLGESSKISQINVGTLLPGMYFLQIQSEYRRYRIKFLKN